MQITTIKTDVFEENEFLASFIVEHIPRLKENSILVVASKIVALSEGRTAFIQDARTKEKLILAGSEVAVATKHCWFTVKDGMVMANAGIDESNSNGKLILLPKDCYRSAQTLRQALRKHYRIKNLGIIISDSRIVPLSAGVIGCTLGYAGFQGLRDYRGKPDIFGTPMRMTQTNITDSLAAAATCLMGEGKEQQPLAIISDAPVTFCNTVPKNALLIKREDDMYQPLLSKLLKS